MHVSVCETVQLLAGLLMCNGGKLEEPEDFKSVHVIYCAFKAKQITSSRDLLSNDALFVTLVILSTLQLTPSKLLLNRSLLKLHLFLKLQNLTLP